MIAMEYTKLRAQEGIGNDKAKVSSPPINIIY